LFSVGTLTMAMGLAQGEDAGLALGAWGAVQATAAGIALAAGGLLRDGVNALAEQRVFGDSLAQAATGYAFVYVIEIALLLATLVALAALIDRPSRLSAPASLSLDAKG
jgi:BCD family chlorophyll transporter-like MFS transporter